MEMNSCWTPEYSWYCYRTNKGWFPLESNKWEPCSDKVVGWFKSEEDARERCRELNASMTSSFIEESNTVLPVDDYIKGLMGRYSVSLDKSEVDMLECKDAGPDAQMIIYNQGNVIKKLQQKNEQLFKIKRQMEELIETLKDKDIIKSWYYNGKYHWEFNDKL
ncbi:MAG: hypothetical protein MJZ37_00040 [Bacilli bacterium]|nr:hypothetical protein [Bacilli bacterium]